MNSRRPSHALPLPASGEREPRGIRLRRRAFLALISAAAVSPLARPLAARAQRGGKLHHIGFLRVGPPPPSFIEPLRLRLNELGYVEGKNIAFDYGIAQNVQQLPELAADFVRRKVDVLVASGTPAVIPARNATSAIPVLFIAAIDPVATGVVASLARPGGNVTGMTAVFSDLTGKRLEFLKEMLPTLTRVALLTRPANPGHYQYVQQTQIAARILRVELEVLAVNSPDDFEPAFRRAADAGVTALIQIDDAMLTAHRQRLVELANRHRIPGAYGFREFVEIGGFMALGPSYSELYRRAADYLDKILKGAKPADLPVQQPTKFELILNLRTAKALGLIISPTLLARADEVIE
jgi:putative ABC transport system substrate-binding protein